VSTVNGYTISRSRNEVYNANTLTWDSMTQPGGSTGSGGDASAANQLLGNVSLASIDTKLTSPVTIAHANLDVALSTIATQATAALIKAKTDNLDAALSTRLSEADFDTKIGSLTETAPTTDIASSGINGRLQRIAQRLSSLIGLLPTALTGNNALRVEHVVAGPTQPVSATSLPLPTGASTETTLAAVSGKLPATLGQKTMAASMAVALASDQGAISISHALTGATNIFKTGTITTAAATADQVVLTYTVTAGKTFYLQYVVMYGRLTTPAATASILGAISLETPSGTKAITFDDMNPTTSELEFNPLTFSEPIPIAAGTVIRIVVTPAAVTSMLWRGNFGGYEK
jgi:hypothetical protein